MCFSATASFTSAALLTLTGAVALHQVKSKPYYLFASIPLIFAFQQFIEGLFWLSTTQSAPILSQQTAAIIFLGIAFVIWPVWIPASLWALEKKEGLRKKIFVFMAASGVFFSSASAYALMAYPIKIYIYDASIVYYLVVNYPFSSSYALFIYAIPTIGSFFVSSDKKMWLLGVAAIGSLAIATYFKEEQLVSVWCFFAALLSLFVVLIVLWENKQKKLI